MPRNPDGTFSRVINWTEEQENVATYTGAKMDSDADDLAQGIEECIDSYGRGGLNNNIPCNGYRLKDLGDAEDLQDSATLNDVYKYSKPSIYMTDNGSIQNIGALKLKTDITNLVVADGFRFTFQMPFKYSAAQIKLAGKYEDFELDINGQKFTGNVIRGPLLLNPSDPNSIIDPCPSFFYNENANIGFIYDMEMLVINEKNYFRVLDSHLDGELIFYPDDPTSSTGVTPAGYINVEFRYDANQPGLVNPITASNPSGTKFKMLQKIRNPANPV